MNKQNTMQPLGETKSLQNIVIDEVCQKISDAVIDAEATSEEKYITKQKLIVSADDMNPQEQLDAMDRNYDRRNQERWQNVLYFAVVSFSVVGIFSSILNSSKPYLFPSYNLKPVLLSVNTLYLSAD